MRFINKEHTLVTDDKGWSGTSDSEEFKAWLFAENYTFPYVEPLPNAKDLLAKLDADNELTQRNLRDTILLMSEAFKTITSGEMDLSKIPGVANVYAVEAKAAILRSQL